MLRLRQVYLPADSSAETMISEVPSYIGGNMGASLRFGQDDDDEGENEESIVISLRPLETSLAMA